jgi:hypothetical protein
MIGGGKRSQPSVTQARKRSSSRGKWRYTVSRSSEAAIAPRKSVAAGSRWLPGSLRSFSWGSGSRASEAVCCCEGCSVRSDHDRLSSFDLYLLPLRRGSPCRGSAGRAVGGASARDPDRLPGLRVDGRARPAPQPSRRQARTARDRPGNPAGLERVTANRLASCPSPTSFSGCQTERPHDPSRDEHGPGNRSTGSATTARASVSA